MQITINELRSLVREEYMRGIQEFVVIEAVDRYVDELMQHLKRHILVSKKDPVSQREAMFVAREVLKDLKKDVVERTQEKLWSFMMHT